ncbi:MAG: DUF1573 domain-containing protein [Verrucomicrobia bacterium]|nr:DUF1573 domain-containing protein [Verrucomicrobiota bacterium]MDA1067791.1 DUF1573 domain-containing protein [Verrucomicrobiota bacterium]
MMNTFAKILLLSLTCPLLLTAGLTFEEARIVHEATMDESEYTGTFVFKNEGDKAVKILEVNSSCGCTTALPSKRVFEPGESGEISATFDYGEREGKQIKEIRVDTDQEKDPRIFLTLEVNIPSAMEFSPSVVMWNRASESDFKAKEVIIESKMGDPIKIMEIVSSSDLFTHKVTEIEKGKKFSISIAPQNIPVESGGIIRGTFVVKTSLSNPLKGTLKVYAIIR